MFYYYHKNSVWNYLRTHRWSGREAAGAAHVKNIDSSSSVTKWEHGRLQRQNVQNSSAQ